MVEKLIPIGLILSFLANLLAIIISFDIKAKENPEENFSVNINWQILFSVELFFPEETFNTSLIVLGSIPNFYPRIIASLAAINPIADT